MFSRLASGFAKPMASARPAMSAPRRKVMQIRFYAQSGSKGREMPTQPRSGTAKVDSTPATFTIRVSNL